MNQNRKLIYNISIISVMSALVLVSSLFSLKIGGIVQGEIEFSDIICFLLIVMYGGSAFAIIAIVPLTISDLIQLPIYAPATFISRCLSTLIIILITKKLIFNNWKSYTLLLVSLLLASFSIIFIYFLWDLIIYGEAVAISDIFGNVIQYLVVDTVVMLLSVRIKMLRHTANQYFSKN